MTVIPQTYNYPHSLVIICPDDNKQALLDLGEAYGVSAGLSVPLSTDGMEPVTHWGARADASPEFVAILSQQVQVPVEGYTQEQISTILSAAKYYVDTDGKRGSEQFLITLGLEGLQTIAPEII